MAYFRTTHKEIGIRLNKFAVLTIPGDFKGTIYQKIEWGITYGTCLERTTYKFYFSEIFKKYLLSASMENTLIRLGLIKPKN